MTDMTAMLQIDTEITDFQRQSRHELIAIQSDMADADVPAALLATYDFQQLIEKFISEVRQALPCDGIEYREDTINLHLIDGHMSRHHCSYYLDVDGKSLGELVFTRHEPFHEHEMEKLDSMVSGLVFPLRHAIRYQNAIRIAQRDSLTGLRNSNYYQDMIELEILRAKRYGTLFTILLIDIDDFQNINNTWGNEAGDQALIEMAGRVEDSARNCDLVFRYGGDEFLVMLPNTQVQGALIAAERIKQKSQSMPVRINGEEVNMTLSVGVSTVNHDDSAFTLIERATSALYHAKILGKDQIRQIDEGYIAYKDE